MNRAIWLRIPFVWALSLAVVVLAEPSLAQHGGHGGGFHGGGFGGSHGGSGFHGGGGSFHGDGGFGGHHGGFNGGGFNGFHGGRGFGGFHGGNSFGEFRHGGFGGFRGGRGFYGNRFYGHRGYGYGFNFGFGFWPYWDAYPYYYGYSPWWWYSPYPYYSPYDGYDSYDRDPDYDRDYECRPDYRHPDNGCDDRPDSRRYRDRDRGRPTGTDVPESYPERNYITSSVEDYRRPDSNDTMARPATPASDFQLAYSTTQQLPPKMRPAVKNVIQALRAMPPEVRERQLNSDRYASFSSAERRLLNTAAHPIAAQ